MSTALLAANSGIGDGRDPSCDEHADNQVWGASPCILRNTVAGQSAAASKGRRRQSNDVEYVPHESLSLCRAEELLSQAADWIAARREQPKSASTRRPTMLLRDACEQLFSPEEERNAFYLFNALKYHAAALRRREALGSVGKQRFDQLMATAAQVRERIVRANLRLAMAIVKRFAHDSNGFDELLSDAMLVLVRAIEKFDFSRGFRFSTYATHAVQRALFRTLAQRQRLHSRQIVEGQELLSSIPDRTTTDVAAVLHSQAIRDLLPQFIATLDPREQLIINARYLGAEARNPPTLQSLAQRMGVCKERARQLEQRAFLKLRRQFGPLMMAIEV